MRFRDPLLVLFAPLAAGIVLNHTINETVGFGFSECATAASALLCLGFFAQKAGVRWKIVPFTVAIVFTGMLLGTYHARPDPPSLSIPDNFPAILEGCVVDPAIVATDRERFTVELAPAARAQISLFARPETRFPALPYGTKVEFIGKVRRPHNYNNPGGFDAVNYFARQHIFWNASGDAAKVRVLPGNCGYFLPRIIFAIRGAALDRLDHLYANDPYSNGMMQAILIGATAKLEKMWTTDYRSTGTFHALVISGSHVAVLAAVLLFFLRVCAVPRGIALAATILMAWLYAGITGWQAPVLRSAVGMSLYGVAGIFYREGRLLNILAGVAILFLIADPEQLFDPSFQLSFLAVALIGAFVVPVLDATSGPLSGGLSALGEERRDPRLAPRSAQFRLEMRLLATTLTMLTRLPIRVSQAVTVVSARMALYFWEIFITSFFIQLGLALPMVLYFHRLSASGLSANAIVVPVLSAVVPLGFLAIGLNSTTLAGLCGALLQLARWAVGIHARWEPDWRIPPPPLWLAVAYVVALIAAAYWSRRGPVRIAAWCVATLALGAIIAHPFPPRTAAGRFELSAIDVGQGDGLLAAFPDGPLMLIDAGGIPAFGRSHKPGIDIGEDVISPYLWSRSIKHLDVVVMTHAHEDHMGGMSSVLRNFHPRELWAGAVQESPEWISVRATATALGIPIRLLRRGEAQKFGGAILQVLAPGPGYQASEKPKNDDSLVIRIQFGSTAFLLTGDMEKRVEQELVSAGLLEHVDVLKVGHHGSRTSTTPALLDAIRPAFGVISDGFENSYGHPHPLTLAALNARHVAVYRTDERGLVTISSDGRRIRVEP